MAPSRNVAIAPGQMPMMQAGAHPQMAMNPQQMQPMDPSRQAQSSEAAKRKARKPTDKTMPDGVEDVIIGDGVQRYRDLRDYERRLDATMSRKRLDIVDSMSRNPKPVYCHKRSKTMRIWISNTVEDQPWQAAITADNFDFSASSDSTYRLKIEGRLLDDDDLTTSGSEPTKKDEEEAQGADRMDTDAPTKEKTAALAGQGPRPRFSHFFESLSVVVDRGHGADPTAEPEQIIEWKKPALPQQKSQMTKAPLPPAADFDEITFKRSGDDNLNVKIILTRSEEPKRYSISPQLAEIVDMKEGTPQEILIRLWDYIRLMGLLEDEEKRRFRCDDLLRKVIGKTPDGNPTSKMQDGSAPKDIEQDYIVNLAKHIEYHLAPLPPIELPYTIRMDEEFHKNPTPTIYDVQVMVDDPLRARMFPFIPASTQQNNPQTSEYASMLKEVARLDEQLAVLVGAVGESKLRHHFFTQMSEDPTNFIKSWLSSQQRDLDIIWGESVRGGDISGDEWRRGGVDGIWNTEGARESVQVMLAKQPTFPR
ncbi:uncharacterized protein PgNI_03695 [Pyricularia grisea]|uniref:DM2 domain-containing protein n=1 Tax=Pyricularia grisea TaxID=148305 RepID=A0A6P8B7X9_PYRGI|nr:uncharacterized protein PgNI_03695 [Pyricularia grisea]TLD11969.1 hypothetical protein PgNI_03695 [Pyricularia grisea]